LIAALVGDASAGFVAIAFGLAAFGWPE